MLTVLLVGVIGGTFWCVSVASICKVVVIHFCCLVWTPCKCFGPGLFDVVVQQLDDAFAVQPASQRQVVFPSYLAMLLTLWR